MFRDDFSKFPPGWLSKPVGLLNGAIQEHHYLPHRGVPTFPWYNPITHNDSWVAGDEDGNTYLEQHLIHDQAERWQPLFVTGDPLWTSYTVSAKVRPLSLAEAAGIVFWYHTNRHYYVFSISGGKRARLALRSPLEQKLRIGDWREVGAADVSYDVRQYHQLSTHPQPALQRFELPRHGIIAGLEAVTEMSSKVCRTSTASGARGLLPAPAHRAKQ